MATVTLRVKPAQSGQTHYKNATMRIQSLLMSIPVKKTSTYNIAIMERSPGWAWMTDQQRVTLLGWIVDMETLQPGPRVSQIISKTRIVCTHLVWNTTTNGTTCSVVIVISLLVRKVSQHVKWSFYVIIFHEQNLINVLQLLIWCYFCNDPVLSGANPDFGNVRKLKIFPSSCIRRQSTTCKSLHFAMFFFQGSSLKTISSLDGERHWESWEYCSIMLTTQHNNAIVRVRRNLLIPGCSCTVKRSCCLIVSVLDYVSSYSK